MKNKFGVTFPVKSLFRFSPRGFFLAVLATVVLSGCGSSGGGGKEGGQTTSGTDTSIIASGVVTSAGGVVSDGSETTLVVIPPGAVTENTTITIRKGVAADGYPVTTFESSVPTGPVRIILPDPDSPSAGGVSSVASSLTMPIDKAADTKFDCRNDSSKDWYRRCAWFWITDNPYGIGNRIPDRVIDTEMTARPMVFAPRPAVLLASECEFMPSATSLCYAGKEPVLFVHGYLPSADPTPGSIPFDPFSENGFGGGGDTYDDFPQQLKLSIPEKAITLFEFRWVTAAKFEDVAQDLGIAIDQIAARTGRKVHVVAHSFGGVLTRTYLQGLAAGGYPYNGNVASLTTLGTPHSGIFDGVTVRGLATYQQGTHPYVGTTQTNACAQLSCYQAGEQALIFGELFEHAKQIFHVAPEPGEITVRLFETRDQLPDVPIQVLIGLAAEDAPIFGVDVKDGDCLISYAGQRFAPDLMTGATIGLRLANDWQIGDARVTEHILGFSDSTLPSTWIIVSNGDPERYGYKHSKSSPCAASPMVGVNSTNANFHDGLERASFWIRNKTSAPSTTPVNIQISGRIVDKQTGAGPGVPGAVLLRPWLVVGQTDVHGNFSIEVKQVMPVGNIEIVATVPGYQQGFQTAIGAGSGGLVSLPDLGLTKTGSATVSSVVMQKLEVRSAGDGNGNVSGQGIGCPSKCSVWLGSGSTVALKAAAWRDSQFSGWSGCARVTGVNGETCEIVVGASGSVATATFTKLALQLPSVPLAPSTPIASALSQSNIAFTWQDNSDSESGFEVERKLGISGTYTRIAELGLSSGTGLSIYFEDTGLVAGTQYCYRARALNAGGYSSYTSEVCATTQAVGTAPSAPTGANATADNGQVTVSWNAVSGATSYNVYWSTISPVTKASGVKLSAVTSPLIHNDLTNGVAYHYVVTAVSSGGESVESQEVLATPAASTSGIPDTVIDSATMDSTTATFTFHSVPSGGTFECKFDNGSYVACSSPQTYSGLVGCSHSFDVRATNAAGTGPAAGVGSACSPGLWTQTAGPGGGEIQSLAVDPATPGTLYAGTPGGGVFKSTDSGTSWSAANTGLQLYLLSDLVVDPTTPGTLYAGIDSGGVFKSTNGGSTWNAANTGLTDLGISTLAVDPATLGTLYAGTSSGGVFKSIDSGATWNIVNTGLPSLTVSDLIVDPATPGVLYAGTFGGGVFKSIDSGATWNAVNTGLTNLSVYTLVVDPAVPGTLYAGMYNSSGGLSNGGGVFKSVNSGATWSSVSDNNLVYASVPALIVDPATGTLYAGTDKHLDPFSGGGVYKSTDGGATWSADNTSRPGPSVFTLVIDPAMPSSLYAGTVDGVIRSTDSGVTWSKANVGLTTIDVYALAADPATPGTLYAGTDHGISKSVNGGASWSEINGPGAQVEALVVDPATSGMLYAGSTRGAFKSANGGATWSEINTGLPPSSGVAALAIELATPGTLYAGTLSGVYKSTNGGATWSASGLTALDTAALAVDPATPGVLYAGTWSGGVFKSTNGGATWIAINTGLPDSSVVNTVVVDSATPGRLYAGTYGGGVFKSIDGGATWSAINTGLPDTSIVYTLVVDSATPSRLYAGTYGSGVFKSTDGGASWNAINSGLDHLGVYSLALGGATSSRTLFAGTAGGSVYAIVNP